MTTLTNPLRSDLASDRPARRRLTLPSLKLTEAQERHVVFAFALALCVGAAALVLHALSLATAFR